MTVWITRPDDQREAAHGKEHIDSARALQGNHGKVAPAVKFVYERRACDLQGIAYLAI